MQRSADRILGAVTSKRAVGSEHELRQEHIHDLQSDRDLRELVAKATVKLTIGVIAVSALVMAAYFWSQWGAIPSNVVYAWLAASVIEVVGILAIVANYLFPRKGKKAHRGEWES